MPPEPSDTALDYLLDSSGLELTEELKQDLKTIYDALTAMKAPVRRPRGCTAEPAHSFGFTAEDLA
jgi:hypothetical protein